MIPHLLHIGFPKTGSTFLQSWFAAHPQIAFSPSGFAGSNTVGDFAYDNVRTGPIRCRVTSAEYLSTPIDRDSEVYGCSLPLQIPDGQDNVCHALADVFPSAYVLIVTRGFEATLRSGYSQLVRSGARYPFSTMITSTGEDANALRYLNYDRCIRMYRARFGERVIALPYELLQDDPDRFLSHLTSSLGLDAGPTAVGPVNPSLKDAELDWYPRISNAIARLPVPAMRRRLMNRHLGWINSGRWRPLLPYLDRWSRGSPAAMAVPEAALAPLRGYATALVREPLYRPYASAYLA